MCKNIFGLLRKYKKLAVCSAFLAVGFYLAVVNVHASENRLVFGLNACPERLVPIKIRSPQTFPVSMQIYEGLFDVNEQGNVIGRIIERWETEDNKMWLFHVRKGVRYHKSPIFKNGTRDVMAKDILYTLTNFCSADSYSSFLLMDYLEGARDYNQGRANSVKGLKVIDPYTLQVTLVKPVPFFINQISTPVLAVSPKELDEREYAEKAGLSMAVGTGPYIFKSMSETEIILEKNEDYWDLANKPQLDKIIYRVIKNDQTRLVTLKRGQIGLMGLPCNLFGAVLESSGGLKDEFKKNFQLKSVPTFNSHLIGINNKVIADPNLRRAMFWGTNRIGMVNSILYGHAQVMGGTVPVGLNGYRSLFEKNLFDPEKAREYLRKSSYSGEPIELIVHDIANSEQIGQIFQAQMEKIGIKIALKKVDFGSAINSIIKGEHQLFSMFFEYAFSSPEPILINMFSSSKIPVPNFFLFSNPSTDQMLNKLYSIKGRKESVDYCAEIEANIIEEVPAIFLYSQNYMILHSRDLTDLEVSGNNHYFLEKVRIRK